MSNDATPTPPRPSRSLHVFADACKECIERLDALALDDAGLVLRHEAANLATTFAAWAKHPPDEADRREAVDRVITLDRGVADYVEARTREGRP